MAEEKAPLANATPSTKSKSWKYVGPGSPGNKDREEPVFGNLPADPKNPKMGTLSGVLHPEDLSDDLIHYVMSTNTAAAKWWVLE